MQHNLILTCSRILGRDIKTHSNSEQKTINYGKSNI